MRIHIDGPNVGDKAQVENMLSNFEEATKKNYEEDLENEVYAYHGL